MLFEDWKLLTNYNVEYAVAEKGISTFTIETFLRLYSVYYEKLLPEIRLSKI